MDKLKYKKLLVELESLSEEQLSDLAKQVDDRKQENGVRRQIGFLRIRVAFIAEPARIKLHAVLRCCLT